MDRLCPNHDPWQRFILLLTRGVLAILFGIVIAEPLVLKVFQVQIEAQIRSDRADTLARLQTKLLLCNPDAADIAAPTAPSDCATGNYVLTPDATPAAQLRQLNELKQAAADLQKTITNDSFTLLALNKKATDECAGHSGEGLTSVYGDGINCKQDKTNAAQFAAAHPIEAQQAQLASTQADIAKLQAATSTTQGTFVAQRAALIKQRLNAEPQVDGSIGLLERMDALALAGSSNNTLWFGIIFVRLLFITIDCSPVLIKVAGGTTHYDKLVGASLGYAVSTHSARLDARASDRRFDREGKEQTKKRSRAIERQKFRDDAVDAREAGYRSSGDARRQRR